ncbi:MAG: lysostaphin resistance A-like protein [Verrucomicrobiia bacterium]
MLSEKPWPPEQVLQLLVRVFASMLLGMLLIGWLQSTNWLGATQLKVATLVIGTASFHGIALLLTHVFLREQGMSWETAFGLLSPRLGRAMLLALMVGIAVLPIAWSLSQLSARMMDSFNVQPVVQGPVQMLQSSSSLGMKAVIGLLAIVVAPCVEELVFRGLIYPTLKQNGFPRLALWGTSILFATVHSNLVILLPLTFLAVVLTLLYEATDNLLAPIVAHSLFNFVNFFWVVAQPAMPVSFWQS